MKLQTFSVLSQQPLEIGFVKEKASQLKKLVNRGSSNTLSWMPGQKAKRNPSDIGILNQHQALKALDTIWRLH